MRERGRYPPWMGRGRRPTNIRDFSRERWARQKLKIYAGRGTNRGTHRAASSRWRFCARLREREASRRGRGESLLEFAVRRERRSPRPTSGCDVTRRHAHRAQWESCSGLVRRASRRGVASVCRCGSRVKRERDAPLETPTRERTARVDAREARALRCARRGQGAKLGLGISEGDYRASQTVCPYPGHHLERTTPLHHQTVEKGARRESSSPSSFDGRRSRTCTACRRAAAWLRESSTPRPASGCERLYYQYYALLARTSTIWPGTASPSASRYVSSTPRVSDGCSTSSPARAAHSRTRSRSRLRGSFVSDAPHSVPERGAGPSSRLRRAARDRSRVGTSPRVSKSRAATRDAAISKSGARI